MVGTDKEVIRIQGKRIAEPFLIVLQGLEHVVGEGNAMLGPQSFASDCAQRVYLEILNYSPSGIIKILAVQEKNKQLFYVNCINDKFSGRVEKYIEDHNIKTGNI